MPRPGLNAHRPEHRLQSIYPASPQARRLPALRSYVPSCAHDRWAITAPSGPHRNPLSPLRTVLQPSPALRGPQTMPSVFDKVTTRVAAQGKLSEEHLALQWRTAN